MLCDKVPQKHQKGLLPCPFIETLCRGLGITLAYVCTSWEGTTFLSKLVEGTSILLVKVSSPPGTENIHYIRLSHWSHPFCSQQRGLGQTPEIPCPERGWWTSHVCPEQTKGPPVIKLCILLRKSILQYIPFTIGLHLSPEWKLPLCWYLLINRTLSSRIINIPPGWMPKGCKQWLVSQA